MNAATYNKTQTNRQSKVQAKPSVMSLLL